MAKRALITGITGQDGSYLAATSRDVLGIHLADAVERDEQ